MTKQMTWLALSALAFGMIGLGCDTKTAGTGGGVVLKGGDHEDEEFGPHGGAIAEWGDKHEFHIEFNVDEDNKQAVVYVLDGDMKPKPIKAAELVLTLTSVKPALVLKLKAVPEASDPKGASTKFVAGHDEFGKEQQYEGSIGGEVEGKVYSGDFHTHIDHEGHDHKKDDKKK